MKLKSKIIVFQLFFIGVVLVMAAVDYFAIVRADRYIERVTLAYRQLETITALSLHANRYSEQIAEMLLFGEQGLSEFEEARRDLETSFIALRQVTEAELAIVSAAARPEEARELNLISEMRAITGTMHETALDLLDLKVAGRDDEAQLAYFGQIEEDLDDRLQQLIDLAIADERGEVARVDGETAALSKELLVIVTGSLLAGIVASIGAVMLLSGALAKPIGRLTLGAAAIGAGQLGHRILIEGKDELAQLSGHFNQMAARLESQHRELRQQHAMLELTVAKRTAELEDANRRLKDLDRLRVLFLADVSHELRTPLTVLRGEAEVTLRAGGSAPEVYRDTLERVVEQSSHMARLVDDLLFVTRAEADSIRFAAEPVDLAGLVGETAEELQVLGHARGVRIVLDTFDGRLPVLGDRDRLRQVALIAIDNAVKYASAGTEVRIRRGGDTAGAVAEVAIRNEGEAIPAEDLPYVFERFYRAHGKRSPSAAAGGTGLGLSIAKWIVEKHGGSIVLRSAAGVTELEFSLPRLDEA